jgi:hypothetical protein
VEWQEQHLLGALSCFSGIFQHTSWLLLTPVECVTFRSLLVAVCFIFLVILASGIPGSPRQDERCTEEDWQSRSCVGSIVLWSLCCCAVQYCAINCVSARVRVCVCVCVPRAVLFRAEPCSCPVLSWPTSAVLCSFACICVTGEMAIRWFEYHADQWSGTVSGT